MENSSPFVQDISSDEESGFGDTGKGAGFGINGVGMSEEDCDWLSKLLGEVDENKEDDSDDVLVLSAVSLEPPSKTRFGPLKACSNTGGDNIDDGDDDDCVVLEGDPDKPVVVVVKDGVVDKTRDGDEDSDDIEIVGEKGEVACRDFPHARHLCVKFIFASTQHKVHCSQCHCYVCDALAPCSYWGTGVSPQDHCHASDKDEYWIAQRKRVKRGGKPASDLPAQIVPTTVDNCLLEAVYQTTQVPGLALQQNQGLSPVAVHPYTMSTNLSVPTAVNQGRTTQFAPPHAVFKRPGLMRSIPRSRHAYMSSLTRDSSPGRLYPLQPPVMGRRYGSYSRNVGRQATAPVLPHPKFPMPNMAAGHSSSFPAQPPRQPMPYPHCLTSPIPCHSETLPQPHVNRDFGRAAVHSQPQLPSQLSTEKCRNFILPSPQLQPRNALPSQTLTSYQSNAGIDSVDHLISRYMPFPHASISDDIENLSSHSQARESLISLLFEDENGFQEGNNTHNGLGASATDFGTGNDFTFSLGDQQAPTEGSLHQTAAAADDCQLQRRRKDDAHQTVVPKENFHPQRVVLADNSSLNGSGYHFPESTVPDLYCRYDNWMTEGHSTPAAWEDPVSPGWQEFVHEHPTVDIATGSLFDI